MLVVRCPACQETLQIEDHLRGQVVRCKRCSKALRTPAPPKPEPAKAAPQALVPTPHNADAESMFDLPEELRWAPAMLGRTLREFCGRRPLWVTLGAAVLAGLAGTGAVLAARLGRADGAGLLMALAGGLAASLVLFRRPDAGRVLVCENGLQWETGGPAESCSWAGVDALSYVRKGWPPRDRLTLSLRDGREVKLRPSGASAAEMLRAIHAPLRPLLLAEVDKSLEAGDGTDFGPLLRLEPWGLVWGGKAVAWCDVNTVACGFHTVVRCAVLTASGRVDLEPLELGAIPNVALLLELLRDRFGVRVEHAASLIGVGPASAAGAASR